MKAVLQEPTTIGGRYRVEEVLGEGGMGAVYRVRDQVADVTLALKRIKLGHGLVSKRADERLIALLEGEYQTLAQLAHPRIIEVFDYGLDDEGPYYTMELLDGEDLNAAAPLPWRDACRVLRDIASALAFLHSRRLIHRDVGPRNIRCTQDGRAKLIDFGAMIPMGQSQLLVGTPPFVPPEALLQQELDGRVDLYALGAVLYWLLTGRHAYPARQFAALRDLWRTPLRTPGSLVDDVPEALSMLAMSLLSLDRLVRPASAAVVMDRLTAIADLQTVEELEVSSAYLTTPTLAGRGDILARVRRAMLHARRRHGKSLLVGGAPGIGRSRLLSACLLEAKLQGLLVLRVDTASTVAGPWGAMETVCGQLIDSSPALHTAAANSNSLPGATVEESGSFARLTQWVQHRAAHIPSDATPQSHRVEMIHALRDWITEVSDSRVLMLAVDDLHRLDEPSAAVLASLADEAIVHPIVIVATLAEDEPVRAPIAVSAFASRAERHTLPALTPEATDALLGSMFGDVPNVRLLSARLHAAADGNPRVLLELAQFLVDMGMIRYEGGLWILPREVGSLLPEHHQQALIHRFEALSPAARRVAEAMALGVDEGLSESALQDVAQLPDLSAQLRALDELERAQVLVRHSGRHSFARQAWPQLLRRRIAPDDGAAMYRRITHHMRERGAHPYRLAACLLLAKDEPAALDTVVEACERAISGKDGGTERDLFVGGRGIPGTDLRQLLDRCIELCERLRRPRRQRCLLELAFLYTTGSLDIAETKRRLPAVLDQLSQDCGLADYNRLADVSADQRLSAALAAAGQRHREAAHADRGFAPDEALTQLPRLLLTIASELAQAMDGDAIAALPSLEPLEPLSPAMGMVRDILRAGVCVCRARYDEALQAYALASERLARPDGANLPPDVQHAARFAIKFAVGLIEAGTGVPSALVTASELEAEPTHEVNAWLMRVIYHQVQGDAEQAEACRARAELLRVQNAPRQYLEDVDLQVRAVNAGSAEDLLELKRLLGPLERRAERQPCWRPAALLVRGDQARILGNYHDALSAYEAGLACMQPARHSLYAVLAGQRVEALIALGRHEQALAFAVEADEICQRDGVTSFVPLARSMAEASLGRLDAAGARCEAFCDATKARGMVGLRLGRAYETGARIAILARDASAFARYAELCAAEYRRGASSALAAKYEALLAAARKEQLAMRDDVLESVPLPVTEGETSTGLARRVDSELGSTATPSGRATRALQMLLARFGATQGYLYTVQRDGVVLSAPLDKPVPPALDGHVRARLERELSAKVDTSPATLTAGEAEAAPDPSVWTDGHGLRYWSLLLHHTHDDSMCITGMAVVGLDSAQRLRPNWDLVFAISRFLQSRGDVQSTVVAF